jgi:hypothetical protein
MHATVFWKSLPPFPGSRSYSRNYSSDSVCSTSSQGGRAWKRPSNLQPVSDVSLDPLLGTTCRILLKREQDDGENTVSTVMYLSKKGYCTTHAFAHERFEQHVGR